MVGLAGSVAAVALGLSRKGRTLSRRLVAVYLALALVASGTMVWVANLGGKIGHPEIQPPLTNVDQERADDDDK